MKYSLFIKPLAMLILVSMSLQVYGGQIINSTQWVIGVDNNGIVKLNLQDGRENIPQADCANTEDKRTFVFDLNTPSGSAWYSGVLSAQAAGKKISVTGTGNCINQYDQLDYENVLSIHFLN